MARPAPLRTWLAAEARRSMQAQVPSLRVGTALLLSFPLAVAAGALLHRAGFDPDWLLDLLEKRAALLFLAMIFSMVALCESVIRHRTQWQFAAEIAVEIALGYLTSEPG